MDFMTGTLSRFDRRRADAMLQVMIVAACRSLALCLRRVAAVTAGDAYSSLLRRAGRIPGRGPAGRSRSLSGCEFRAALIDPALAGVLFLRRFDPADEIPFRRR